MIPESDNPYRPPQADLEPPSAEYVEGQQPPVPFEDIERIPSFWDRVIEMFKLAFKDPMQLFERVPVTNGLGAPWRFSLVALSPLLLMYFVLAGVLVAVLGTSKTFLNQKAFSEAAGVGTAIVVAFLILMPALMFIGMVISGAINHFFLWVWGGTRNRVGLEQTIRADSYSGAIAQALMIPLQILGLIPLLGMLFQLALLGFLGTFLVFKGMGLARMHRTDTWRGICAVLTPIALCCCIVVPILVAAGVTSALNHR